VLFNWSLIPPRVSIGVGIEQTGQSGSCRKLLQITNRGTRLAELWVLRRRENHLVPDGKLIRTSVRRNLFDIPMKILSVRFYRSSLRCSFLFSLKICFALFLQLSFPATATSQTDPVTQTEDPADGNRVEVAQQVDIAPAANDSDIADRLERILDATGWFGDVSVRVDEGVVFLDGEADSESHKAWAAELATKTQAVVTVVNNMDVREPPLWDMSSSWDALGQIGTGFIRSLPLLIFGLILVLLTFWFAMLAVRGTRAGLKARVKNQLLRDVLARAVSVPVFLLGVYLILKVTGMTRLAVTVLGGTGLIGLVVGFAFRDIAENFLASILISMQRPFASGDLISVAGSKGFVHSVNTRSTLLMTLEGNHLQIPNATIYKEVITNYSANPFIRMDFTIGIGYSDKCSDAQAVALSVLQNHEAVLKDPEPLVLVESLGASTVNLRIYYWVKVSKYNGLKVQSAVLRMTKQAFEQAGISMPDEAREVVFPDGVPVNLIRDEQHPVVPAKKHIASYQEPAVLPAEGDLLSEADAIKEQAKNARNPEEGNNLLDS
jgi:small conductance mechanosensitive channel